MEEDCNILYGLASFSTSKQIRQAKYAPIYIFEGNHTFEKAGQWQLGIEKLAEKWSGNSTLKKSEPKWYRLQAGEWMIVHMDKLINVLKK